MMIAPGETPMLDLNPVDWVSNKFTESIQNWLTDVANGISDFAGKLVHAVLVTPVNMDTMPGFADFLIFIQAFASACLCYVVLKEILMNQLEDIGDMGVSPLVIIKNAMVSAFLIWLSPLIITQVLIPIMGDFQVYTSKFLGTQVSNNFHQWFTIDPKTGNINALMTFVGENPSTSIWVVILLVLVVSVCLCIMAFQAGLRWAELYFLALMGPLLALSKASYGNTWNLWLKETIATVMEQVVQFFAIEFAFVILTKPDILDTANGNSIPGIIRFCVMVGILIFGLKGPSKLRSLIGGDGGPAKALGALARAGMSAAGGVKGGA